MECTIGHFPRQGKALIAPTTETDLPYKPESSVILLKGVVMIQYYRIRHVLYALSAIILMLLSQASAQEHPPFNLGPSLRPMLRMTGIVNAKVEATETRPVVTLSLPGHTEQYTFLVTDTKLLAGPLRTPSDILAEVKPYLPNFRLRGPQELMTQISRATPTTPISITGEYSRNGRLLFVQSVENVEEHKS